jgi:hypothetical protein
MSGKIMLFEKLHEGTHCECLNDNSVSENTTDTFARRVRQNPPMLEDFQSWHEEGKRLRASDRENCEVICMYRGVSMNIINDTNEVAVKEYFADTVRLRPKSPWIYCKFRLLPGAGKVRPTPTTHSGLHHTLYKCDDFAMDKLQILELLPLVT